MKQFLRWLLNFLETRFPEKIVMTPNELVALRTLPSRMEKVEAEINKFNYAMGFGALPKGQQQVLER
jgi:hypothetical protein